MGAAMLQIVIRGDSTAAARPGGVYLRHTRHTSGHTLNVSGHVVAHRAQNRALARFCVMCITHVPARSRAPVDRYRHRRLNALRASVSTRTRVCGVMSTSHRIASHAGIDAGNVPAPVDIDVCDAHDVDARMTKMRDGDIAPDNPVNDRSTHLNNSTT